MGVEDSDLDGDWSGIERRGGGAGGEILGRIAPRKRRPHWRDIAIFAAAAASLFVAAVAGYFLVLTLKDYGDAQARRDQDRQLIIRELDMHRCRTEQLMQDLYATHRIPVPAYPDGVEPPANCAVIGNRTKEVAP